MRTLLVSPSALAHIHATIRNERITRPLVVVVWSKGNAELKRADNGEAVWVREPDEWLTTVLDLENVGAWHSPVRKLHGFNFSLSGRPGSPDLEGCTLECEGGHLVIHETRA
jgi:hypothetical protein